MIPAGIMSSRAASGAADPTSWLASSAALPSSMTLTRGSAGLYLSGASFAAATYLSASTNVARYERLASSKIGLLIEGARTNLQIRSHQFATDWTTIDRTSKADATGDLIAGVDSIQVTVASAGTNVLAYIGIGVGGILSAGPTYTEYALLRNGTIGWAWVNLYDGVDFGGIFNLSAGTYAGNRSGTSVTGSFVQPSGLGYYLCGFKFVSVGTGINTLVGASSDGTLDLACNFAGGETFDISHSQIEQADFPSSPIITAGSNATRNADVTIKTVSPPGGGFAAVFEIKTAPGRSGNQFIACWHDTTANERVDLYINSSGAVRLTVVDGGSTVADITGGTIAVSTEAKVAISLEANSIGLAVAGTAATRDTSNTLPTLTRMCFGHDISNANHLFGHIISGPDGTNWLSTKSDGQLVTLTT